MASSSAERGGRVAFDNPVKPDGPAATQPVPCQPVHVTLLKTEHTSTLDEQLNAGYDDDLEGKQAVLILYYLFEDASCKTRTHLHVL
jgi:hypothetical protein